MKKILYILLLSSSLPIYALYDTYTYQSYHEVQKAFEENNAWGLHVIVDLQKCNPDLIRSRDSIQEYVVKLCDLIGMKRYGPTWIEYFGEDERIAGYSMSQPIETSLVSGHFANDTNNAYIDIFSCKLYDPYIAAAFTQTFFKAESMKLHIVLR